MTADYVVDISGESGSPILLLAGGASSSRGFFPGLVEALPGYRIISLDRRGTGQAQASGAATLPSGSAAAAEVLEQLGVGPAVVVGQSLGGAVAVQFAVDHPELVSGLVLIDPTPLDVPSQVRLAKAVLWALSLPGRLPIVGRRLDPAVFRLLARKRVSTDARDAVEVMTTSASLAATVRSVDTTVEETAALMPRLRQLDAPVVVLTADRRPEHPVRLSHERLVAALGGRLVAPPNAVHAEHLRDPEGVNRLVQEVVQEASARCH